MRARIVRVLLSATTMLLLVGGLAMADYQSWSANGFGLTGALNPLTFSTYSPCGNPAVCGAIETFDSRAFSQTPSGGLWVGADYQLGEWCGDASAATYQTESGWGWALNTTNQWVSSQAKNSQSVLSCSNHMYGAKGWHNLHDPNSTQVDDYENTYEFSAP